MFLPRYTLIQTQGFACAPRKRVILDNEMQLMRSRKLEKNVKSRNHF